MLWRGERRGEQGKGKRVGVRGGEGGGGGELSSLALRQAEIQQLKWTFFNLAPDTTAYLSGGGVRRLVTCLTDTSIQASESERQV